ncbi:hypothetical protein DQ244_10910 [Blastococcus sp. TBT05-19]|uniref:hypothetical protein n=1 Tax=Blastococcus sp. TBT05-19 TaxID=2250581 RepID=UPI000DEAE2BE|nr:hypothetical protein [Blastococcus sp. TBT05-19]RBY91785.1 hypothetical protein DQ244_10910 [Blastococcus sp. TBT05-19]
MTGHDVESSDPPPFSRRWWTDTNPYWGEWRSGPWGRAYLALVVVLLPLGAYFSGGTWQGWITAIALLAFVLVASLTARPGRRSDMARLRRHQHGYRGDHERDG